MSTTRKKKQPEKPEETPQAEMQWRRVDLHIHTPASSLCYKDSGHTYLDILKRAEEKGLDIIAFTDHNSVGGYAAVKREVEDLAFLESLGRLTAEEKTRLDEYDRILAKILVLPGFEFTATLGFHILGIFSETTSVRKIEHILLDLNVPEEKLDIGSSEVGATTDVLQAYAKIAQEGGLVIAAHANSSHGVVMQGYNFGGQTKIAYTQDPNLHALEVTDLENTSRRATASFFDGNKPEYPRRMHCIQGSDAHRLERDPKDKVNNLGVGDRITEILLPEVSFEALKEVFLSSDFSRTRPYRPKQEPIDYVKLARERGPNLVQSFHDKVTSKRKRARSILMDVVAFANTNGGTVYIGVPPEADAPVPGIERPEEAVKLLKKEIQQHISPPLNASIDIKTSDSKHVIQISVPRGTDRPYALDSGEIFVRQESDTSLAVRDEIVRMVTETNASQPEESVIVEKAIPEEQAPESAPESELLDAPRTGVEIVNTVERDGVLYHTMRDLRNGSLVHNVTRFSARKLWRYAIGQKEAGQLPGDDIRWLGDIGLWKSAKRAGVVRYDLVQRDQSGDLHIYYGVTDEGVHGPWKALLESADSPAS